MVKFIIDVIRYSWAAMLVVIIVSLIIHIVENRNTQHVLPNNDTIVAILAIIFFIPCLLAMLFVIPFYCKL